MQKCTSTTKPRHVVGAILTLLSIWFLLSLFNHSMVVPKIDAVFFKLVDILGTKASWRDILITLNRLVVAMFISIFGGIGLGTLFATIFPFKDTVREILKMLQIIPPISLLIMAIMWFGLTGRPSIFIVIMALIPLIATQTLDAIENIDEKLVEMGKSFKFSKFKMLRHIYLPSIEPVLWSSVIVSLALGSKMIVMGEVLTTSTGIGGNITTARLNLEPESVIAWTLIIMSLYYVIEYFINKIKDRNRFELKDYFD